MEKKPNTELVEMAAELQDAAEWAASKKKLKFHTSLNWLFASFNISFVMIVFSLYAGVFAGIVMGAILLVSYAMTYSIGRMTEMSIYVDKMREIRGAPKV